MKCPKCFGKVSKEANRCIECGFDLSKLKSFSNKEVVVARKEYRHDEIIMSNVMPSDVSRKKFNLLLAFLGIFGAHNFYVHNNLKGIIMLAFSLILVLTSCVVTGLIPLLTNINPYVTTTVSIFGAVSFLLWVFDIMNVILKKYLYPAVEVD